MDTLTHMLLGACIGQAIGYKKYGAKAMVFGALGAGLPDIDVFWTPFTGEYGSWKYHRHVTHALWFGPLIGAMLGWGLWRHYDKIAGGLKIWLMVMIISILSHPALDFCTVYGTQLLAPFSNHRFEISSVSIIDPIYSLILLFTILVVSIPKFRGQAVKAACVGLILTTSYLVYGIYLNNRAEEIASAQLQTQGVKFEKIEAFTTIFQPFLRRVLVGEADAIRVGFVSTFSPQPIFWTCQKNVDVKIQQAILKTNDAQIFNWFSIGHLGFSKSDKPDEYIVTDLRYGVPGPSVFGWWGQIFKVTFTPDGQMVAQYVDALRMPRDASLDAISNLFKAAYGQDNTLLPKEDINCR